MTAHLLPYRPAAIMIWAAGGKQCYLNKYPRLRIGSAGPFHLAPGLNLHPDLCTRRVRSFCCSRRNCNPAADGAL